MVAHDLVYHVLSFPVLVIRALYEDISHACSRHILLGNLDLGTTFELELTDSFTSFSDY